MNNKSIYSDGFKEQALVKVYSRGDRAYRSNKRRHTLIKNAAP